MFAFANPQRVFEVLTAAAWTPPQLDKLDLDLDIAAGRGLEEAVVQSTQIGAVNSWLRNQPAEIVLSRHRVPPRGAGGASGRRERALARCDVVGQQRARLSASPLPGLITVHRFRCWPKREVPQCPL